MRVRALVSRSVELGLLFIALLAAVLLTIRPWSSFFISGLAEHWDTKLMGQWMAWNAHNIGAGNVLLPDFNANFFYPHSYSLAFSELLWPPSFVYALLYAYSKNLFFSFNGTMLAFWSLSGVAMFALLRELSVGRVAAYIGSLIFCLMPFRLAYYVEFNMTLVFVIPLLLLLTIRWLRHPSIANAILFCAGFWISLTSSIYYTLITLLPLFFIVVVFLIHHKERVLRKDLIVSTAILVVLTTVIGSIYLYPYAVLRFEGGYVRTISDHAKHFAQPLHYLYTGQSPLLGGLFAPHGWRMVETVLFPGASLCILIAANIAERTQRFRLDPADGGLQRATLLLKFFLWSLFWLVVLLNIFLHDRSWVAHWNAMLTPIIVLLALVHLYVLLWPRNGGHPDTVVVALGAAAVFSFFITLGPSVTYGSDRNLHVLSVNPVFQALSTFPMFEALRGLSRFAIIVLVYWIVAGCRTLDGLIRRRPKATYLSLALPLFLIYEGHGLKQPSYVARLPYEYTDYVDRINSKVARSLQELPEESVIFLMPAGWREVDANIVMHTIGNYRYLVNGHSGFAPRAYDVLSSLVREWRIGEITDRLSEIWPPVYLILDKGWTGHFARSWRSPFPYDALKQRWKRLADDEWYSLYALKPAAYTSRRILKRVRSDVLGQNRFLRFSARTTNVSDEGLAGFRVIVNGTEFSRHRISDALRQYEVIVPLKYRREIEGDEIVLELIAYEKDEAGLPPHYGWEVRDLGFYRTALQVTSTQ